MASEDHTQRRRDPNSSSSAFSRVLCDSGWGILVYAESWPQHIVSKNGLASHTLLMLAGALSLKVGFGDRCWILRVPIMRVAVATLSSAARRQTHQHTRTPKELCGLSTIASRETLRVAFLLQCWRTHDSFLTRCQRGHPGVVLLLVVSNPTCKTRAQAW